MDPNQFIARLRDFITSAYLDYEFREVLFLGFPADTRFDFDGLVRADRAWGQRVFDALQWANRVGQSRMVLWIGDLACDGRPERGDGRNLVEQFRASLAPDANGPAPPTVDALLQTLEERTLELTRTVRDVRQALRGVRLAG